MDIRSSFSFNRAACNCKCHKPSRCLHCNCDESQELCKPKLSRLGSFSSSVSRGFSLKTHRVCQDSNFVYSSPGKRIAKCIASALRSARKKLDFEVGMRNGSSIVTIKPCESATLTADPFQTRGGDVGKKQVIPEYKGALPYWHLPNQGNDVESAYNQGNDVESEYSHDEESGYSSSDLFELKNLHI